MTDRPNGAELLKIAREALTRDLVSELPEGKRYLALMVANAMAIAARELGAPAWDERADAAKLAAQIRAGACDAPAHRADVLQRLREITRRRLEVSNPRVLEGARP